MEYKLSSGHKIDLEGKIIFVKDTTGVVGETIYTKDPDTQETYIGEVNTTGYGAPNPDRNTIALFLVAKLKKSTGDVDLTIKSYDPLVVNEWEVIVTEDGWYEFSLIAVELTPSAFNDRAYYDSATTRLLDYVNGKYVEVQAKSLTNKIYHKVTTDKLVLVNITKKKISINTKKLQLLREVKIEHREINHLQDQYNYVRSLIEAAVYEFCRGYKAEAQRNVEFLTNLPIDCC